MKTPDGISMKPFWLVTRVELPLVTHPQFVTASRHTEWVAAEGVGVATRRVEIAASGLGAIDGGAVDTGADVQEAEISVAASSACRMPVTTKP